MKLYIDSLAIEVTRKCNLVCKNFCMRGNSQNINISKEYIDILLDSINRGDIYIYNLLFSGGEPCLNEEIIVYTTEKIINEQLPIESIGVITNGHIISYPIIKVLEKFNFIRKNEFKNTYSEKDYATIAISRDFFHKPLSDEHLDKYKKACTNIKLKANFIEKQIILKTGLATQGVKYRYEQLPILFDYYNENFIEIKNGFYLTTTGFLTTNGDGSYEDMDINNLGHIKDVDLVELIYNEINQKKKQKSFWNIFKK